MRDGSSDCLNCHVIIMIEREWKYGGPTGVMMMGVLSPDSSNVQYTIFIQSHLFSTYTDISISKQNQASVITRKWD